MDVSHRRARVCRFRTAGSASAPRLCPISHGCKSQIAPPPRPPDFTQRSPSFRKARQEIFARFANLCAFAVRRETGWRRAGGVPLSAAGPKPKLSPIAPNPIAETSSPWVPSLRRCIACPCPARIGSSSGKEDGPARPRRERAQSSWRAKEDLLVCGPSMRCWSSPDSRPATGGAITGTDAGAGGAITGTDAGAGGTGGAEPSNGGAGGVITGTTTNTGTGPGTASSVDGCNCRVAGEPQQDTPSSLHLAFLAAAAALVASRRRSRGAPCGA
jgi:hypothetical protein